MTSSGGVVTTALEALGLKKKPNRLQLDAANRVLSPGQTYRVWALADEAYVDRVYRSVAPPLGQTAVQERLSADLTAAGFAHALLAVQDPSDARVWTMIATWQGPGDVSGRVPLDVGPLRLLSFDPVDPPPESSPIVQVPSLDVGLTEADMVTLGHALSQEIDPKRLSGLARSYDEDFPVAASLLRNKARLEDLSRSVNRLTGPARVDEREGKLSLQGSDHPVLETLRTAAGAFDHGSYLESYANVFRALSWPDLPPPPSPQVIDRAVRELFAAGRQGGQVDADERSAKFGKIASILSRNPSLTRDVAPGDLARQTSSSPAIALAGLLAIQDLGHGLSIVRPEVTRRMLPRGPKPASLGALKMAHAVMRPEGSLAAAPAELGGVLSDLRKAVRGGDTFAAKAESAIDRARRLLDRQNWGAWQRRYLAAENVTL